MFSQGRSDEAIQVVVNPSQAAYFAGERLTITITITNTRVPQPTQQPLSTSRSSHRRGAHSVSYVPMARPPTSPGTKTVLPVASTRPSSGGTVVVRRGIIGKTRPPKAADEASIVTEQTKRRVSLVRSQSMSLAIDDLRVETPDDERGKSPIQSLRAPESSAPCTSYTHIIIHLYKSHILAKHRPPREFPLHLPALPLYLLITHMLASSLSLTGRYRHT